MRIYVFLALFLIFSIIPSSAPRAQNADTGFDRQRIEQLQQEQEATAAQAEKLKKQAAEYRELAESAERYAAQASNDRDREDWLKTARGHRANAEKLELDAARQLENADETAGRAGDLQGQVDEKETRARERQQEYDRQAAELSAREEARRQAEANNPNTGLRVKNVIGLWRDAAHEDEPFVIVQKDPNSKAYPNELELHNPRRTWKGTFHTDPPPGEPLITMSYKPKAEEMNSEIPEWARKKIEGELEWKLEINGGGTCGTPALTVDFYPGEVKWKETGGWFSKGDVSIEGRGTARRFDLHQSVPDMRAYTYGASQLFLRPPGMPQQVSDEEAAKTGDFNEHLDTVDALVHGQRFFINVVLPYEEAEKQGDKLTVDIKASGGDSTTVELQRSSLRRGRSAVYTHYDEITISDPLDATEEDRDPPLLSMNYILGYQGARIDLDVENGEIVTFSYGEASQAVPVFNSWVQRGINRHQEAIQRLRPFYSLILSDPHATKAQKEEATDRLTMISNYEHIMKSEEIHDFIRNKVGEAYFGEAFGLVGMTDEQVQSQAELTGSYYPLTDAARRETSAAMKKIYDGVVWTSGYERYLIQNTVVSSRVTYRETALNELPKAITFAMYEIVAGMSGVGDIYTMRTGKDIFGKPVPMWQRIMAGVSLASSNILTFTAPHVMSGPEFKGFNPAQLSRRAMRSGARMRLKTHEHITAKYGAQKIEAAMKEMSAEQVNSVAPGRSQPEDVTPSETPVGCAGTPEPPTNISAPPPRPQPLDAKILAVKRTMGQNTEVVNPGADPLLPPQEFETCQCASTQLAMKEDLGTAISEMSQFGMLVRKGHVVPGKNMPLSTGYTDAQLTAFLQETGAEVMIMPARGGRALSLEAMEAWMNRGWRVRDVIKTVDDGSPHAIQPRRFIRNDKGEITEVQWFDPAFGKELKTPVCDYLNKLAFDGYDTILYRWKEGDAPGGTQAASAQPKPTIEYPNGRRSPGASAGESEGGIMHRELPPDENVDPNSIVQLDEKRQPITEASRQAHQREVERLDRRLDELYPGETKPRLNTIPRESLKKIYADGVWQPPSGGGASFSRAQNDVTARNEVVAVKVREGHENFVEWTTDRENRGLSPTFWPSGKIGEGKSTTYIPAEHLEWIDGDQKTWVPFTEKKLEVDEFTLE
ncbi:MAG: hypothetical protein EPN97_08780 [Alphaproteobacteria bacterium]|nr:MAG: hypothetical protein EPN97_08780 [Alphaproteobacteria bacterium]